MALIREIVDRPLAAERQCVMRTDPLADVPSLIDLRSMADAREWASTAMAKRPWRTEFFHRIADELSHTSSAQLSILELGSGPGFLARHLLTALPTATYVALDFSPAMHELAKERLGELADRVQFVEADFRAAQWSAGLPRFDAVVTVQTVHELRHKRHAPSLYRTIRNLVYPGGQVLMCDHFAGPAGMGDIVLFMTPEEHETALRSGGFSKIDLLLQKEGMVLFSARRSGDASGR
jgi:SAM-dependent methyltransferase